ncbi:MAG: hypothetical protein CVU29_11255 [Betaproteobacteria bacterium HGW-Betaproteobacteria-22]|nr:MAG: hypothetical protein CVU29_11255 [Betaproteobacteria bacterium HGW-Betaproteobacteria-22]
MMSKLTLELAGAKWMPINIMHINQKVIYKPKQWQGSYLVMLSTAVSILRHRSGWFFLKKRGAGQGQSSMATL